MKKAALIIILTLALVFVISLGTSVFADGETEDAVVTVGAEETAGTSDVENVTSTKAVAAASVVAVVAAAGAIGMAVAIAKCASAMSRQPEVAGKINSAMMLGLVFIETAIIYALIIAILIIFVL